MSLTELLVNMMQTWQVWDRQLEYMLSLYTCWLLLLSELVSTLLAIFTMFQVLWMWIFVNGNGHPKWFSDSGPSTYVESMESSKYLMSMDLIITVAGVYLHLFGLQIVKNQTPNSVTTTIYVTEYERTPESPPKKNVSKKATVSPKITSIWGGDAPFQCLETNLVRDPDGKKKRTGFNPIHQKWNRNPWNNQIRWRLKRWSKFIRMDSSMHQIFRQQQILES